MSSTRPCGVRRLAAALSSLVLLLAVVAVLTGSAHPDDVVGGGAPGWLLLEVAAAALAWGAGTYTAVELGEGFAGILMALAGLSVILTGLAAPDVGPALLFTVALLGQGLVATLAAASAASYAGVARRLVGACVGVVLLLHTLPPLLLLDPQRHGCYACPKNLLAVADLPGLEVGLARLGEIASLTVGVVLVSVAVARWVRLPRVVRNAVAPTTVPGVVVAVFGAAGSGHQLLGAGEGFDAVVRAMWLAQCMALLAMALGVVLRVAQARRLRDRVADLVLAALPDAERLRTTLAGSLGDPKLALVFPVDDVLQSPGAGRHVLDVRRGDRVVAQVLYDVGLRAVPERVTTAVQACALALEHAGEQRRLQAELAHLSELRSRIVAAGDAERRRLERNLHDGSQQRLIALAVALQTENERSPDPVLDTATAEVLAALDELRSIAHGIYPASLSDAGLSAALTELAEECSVPLRLERVPETRCDTGAETTTYRVIADVVSCAEVLGVVGSVRVHVSCEAAALLARIDVDGGDVATYTDALVDAAERAKALGGHVRVQPGVVIDLWAPCDS